MYEVTAVSRENPILDVMSQEVVLCTRSINPRAMIMLKNAGIDMVWKNSLIDNGVPLKPIHKDGIMSAKCARVYPAATPMAPQRIPMKNAKTREAPYITAHQKKVLVFF